MSSSDSHSPKPSRWQHAPLIASGVLLASMGVAYAVAPEFRSFLREAIDVLSSDDEPRITRWVARFGWVGPLLLIAAMIAQIFLVIIPSWGLMIVSVLAYGPVWGTVLSLVATAIAASVGYGVGKAVGDAAVRKLLGDKTEKKVAGWVSEYGFWAVFFARASPFISGDAISLIGGLSRIGFPKFIGATVLGAAPLAIAIGYFGENTQRLKTGFIWMTAVSLLLFLGYYLYRRKAKKADE
ncbi:TVP38/TMEM64 family protein [Larkinella bovis]|uniref:TVP38/TMEM64 family membrane protein n=1 Tax=Larkinella bovis TaxID=683041 RepID=A0ABW0ICX6_9BACT